MKKLGWQFIALFMFAFLVTLVILAPATFLAAIVERATQNKLVLANASGSMWQGSATPALRQRTGNLVALEVLHWDVALLPLFGGKMVTEFRWGSAAQGVPMTATLSLDSLELRQVNIPLPASIFAELSPMLQPVQLSGAVQIRSDVLAISRQGLVGSAVAEWTHAGSALSMVNPLGSYRLNLTGAGEKLDVTLNTLSGVLLLEGAGSFIINKGLRFSATARAAPESQGRIDELLRNFGPESAPGVRTLNLMP